MSDTEIPALEQVRRASMAFIRAHGFTCPDNMPQEDLDRLFTLAMTSESVQHVAAYLHSDKTCFGKSYPDAKDAEGKPRCAECTSKKDCQELTALQTKYAAQAQSSSEVPDRGTVRMIVLHPRPHVFMRKRTQPDTSWPNDAPFRLISFDLERAVLLTPEGELGYFSTGELLELFRVGEEDLAGGEDGDVWTFILTPGSPPTKPAP